MANRYRASRRVRGLDPLSPEPQTNLSLENVLDAISEYIPTVLGGSAKDNTQLSSLLANMETDLLHNSPITLRTASSEWEVGSAGTAQAVPCHCPPHRMVLASKAAQKEIPDFVEKLVGNVLFYFRDSPTRRDQFKSLLELTDPDQKYIAIVQYHKIRWLSLSDCVNWLCMLLPLLVRFFEAEMRV